MNDMTWLKAYVGEPLDLQQQSTSNELDEIPSIKPPHGGKQSHESKPWLPKFPALDQVAALRAQFFDNGPTSVKGKTQHTLKLRVYLRDKPLDQHKPDWTRIVQLIDPTKVVAWARTEHKNDRLTEDDLGRYQSVGERATVLMNSGDAVWAKMGHIGSKPGNHYFHNQFVFVALDQEDTMSATVFVEGGEIEIDTFYPNHRSSKANAPKLHGLFDPLNLIRGKADE